MGFNESELIKIEKATSGFFKKAARAEIVQKLLSVGLKIEAAKQLKGDEREVAIKKLVNEATDARHVAIQRGAASHGHPEWAAAAACESWLHELVGGTEESIARVEIIIDRLMRR